MNEINRLKKVFIPASLTIHHSPLTINH